MPLIAQLQGRRIVRALVGYGIAAFAVLQIVEPIMHGMHWPESVLSYVVVGLAAGFPVVVTVAWIFDVRSEPALPGEKEMRLRKGTVVAASIALGVLAATPGLLWYFVLRARAPGPASAAESLASVAVLPFANLSSDKEQEYFTDGITEEIINTLVQIKGLHVTGRTSSFAFKGTKEDLRNVGQKLGVATVLEGSVRKVGSRVRISAQMIKVADGFHLWSETYDRGLTDIFAVQNDIARSVADAAKVRLLPTQSPVPQARHTTNTEAYTQFLIGRQFYNRYTPESYERAVEAYERALRLDPGYGPAHAGLGLALGWLVGGAVKDVTPEWRKKTRDRSIAECERGVELAPDLAEVYVSRGTIRLSFQMDWSGARSDLTRAAAIAPGDASAQLWLGHLLAVVGRLDEAIVTTRKAIDLDPLQALAWDYLGRYQVALGELDKGRASFEQAERISPEEIWVRREIGFTYLLGKDPARALTFFAGMQGFFQSMGLAMAHHDLGHREQAQKALESILAMADPPAYQIAQVYAWWDDRDRAFEWLERSRAIADAGLQYVKYDPMLRNLRHDPRYAAFLAELRLSE